MYESSVHFKSYVSYFILKTSYVINFLNAVDDYLKQDFFFWYYNIIK